MAEVEARDQAHLIRLMDAGADPSFLFFWGHTEQPGRVTKACFSQWYPAAFDVDGTRYAHAEQYMMAEKARLFHDDAVLARIMATDKPGAAKALGREVCGFDPALWDAHRVAVVTRANEAKFGQNPALGAFLRDTGRRVLVEASPQDRIWGIGLAADHPDAGDPHRWCGPNLLGFVLMDVRARLTA